MDSYICSVCQWVYNPTQNNNISFNNLPDNFVCPVCGASKNQFEKE